MQIGRNTRANSLMHDDDIQLVQFHLKYDFWHIVFKKLNKAILSLNSINEESVKVDFQIERFVVLLCKIITRYPDASRGMELRLINAVSDMSEEDEELDETSILPIILMDCLYLF